MNNQSKNINQNPTSAEQPRSDVSNQNIQIGRIIQDELKRQGRTVTWFSQQIHCERRNAYDIFERASIDTDQLMKISRVLGVDFFKYYSNNLQSAGSQQLTPPENYKQNWPA